MKAIDRVMAAYRRAHALTEDQAKTIRDELSKFIDDMIAGRLPAPRNDDGDRRLLDYSDRKTFDDLFDPAVPSQKVGNKF